MPKASELGLVEDSGFKNMEIGQKLEASGFKIEPVSETRQWETAILETSNGQYSTTSKTVLGQLKSDNPKSVGKLIEAASAKDATLTVFVVKNVNPANNNVGYKLSIFEP